MSQILTEWEIDPVTGIRTRYSFNDDSFNDDSFNDGSDTEVVVVKPPRKPAYSWPHLSPEEIELIRQLASQNVSWAEIARRTGRCRPTIMAIGKDHKPVKTPPVLSEEEESEIADILESRYSPFARIDDKERKLILKLSRKGFGIYRIARLLERSYQTISPLIPKSSQ